MIIKNHNRQIITEAQDQQETKTGNCRKKEQCPLESKCLEKCLVYKATVTTNGESKAYYGSTQSSFKERYNNHTASFRHEYKRNSTKLSQYIWDKKDEKKDTDIKWEIVKKTQKYQTGSRKCDLCNTEKLTILKHCHDINVINARTELVSKCPHARAHKLERIKRSIPSENGTRPPE